MGHGRKRKQRSGKGEGWRESGEATKIVGTGTYQVSVTTISASLRASSGEFVKWILSVVPASSLTISPCYNSEPERKQMVYPHPLPHPLIDSIIPLRTRHRNLHAQPRHRHHDLINDIVGVPHPGNLLSLETFEGVDVFVDGSQVFFLLGVEVEADG